MKPQDLSVYRFQAKTPGPRLLVLGAVHGDEICGTLAISRLLTELNAGIVTLTAGSLTCVPICNPDAYARNLRCIEHNLNRIITPHAQADSHEHAYANAVIALIDECDVLLDLHSYTSGDKPFLFLDKEDDLHRAYARAAGIPHWVAGWNDLYATQGELNAGDTVSYAQNNGKIAMLVECGTHTDPAAAHVGYNCLRAALSYFSMTSTFETNSAAPAIHRLTSIVVKQREGDFVRDWRHLDPVRAGEVIACYADGEEIRAPHDGVVIMPGRKADIGSEWLYFGKAE